MRIGFITTSFPRFENDPAGNFVYGMAAALKERGHRITVLAPSPRNRMAKQCDPNWPPGMELVPVSYGWLNRRRSIFYEAGVPDNLARNPWLAGQIPGAMINFVFQALKRAATFDAVVSHWLLPSSLIAGIARKRKQPHLAIAHSSDIHLLKQLPLSGPLARRIANSADHLGFVTERLRNEFLALLNRPLRDGGVRSKTSVTPMGINAQQMTLGRDRNRVRRELSLKQFTVLYLGRLVPIKGVDSLIDAASRAGEIELLVAGKGPELGRLRGMANKRSVSVRFVGEVGPLRRAELFKAADVVAVPSCTLQNGRAEGLPLVITEALAAGRPVVASTVADSEGLLVKHRCGLVVNENSPKTLAQALGKLRGDPSLLNSFGENGICFGQQMSWTNLVKRYESLLESDIQKD